MSPSSAGWPSTLAAAWMCTAQWRPLHWGGMLRRRRPSDGVHAMAVHACRHSAAYAFVISFLLPTPVLHDTHFVPATSCTLVHFVSVIATQPDPAVHGVTMMVREWVSAPPLGMVPGRSPSPPSGSRDAGYNAGRARCPALHPQQNHHPASKGLGRAAYPLEPPAAALVGGPRQAC